MNPPPPRVLPLWSPEQVALLTAPPWCCCLSAGSQTLQADVKQTNERHCACAQASEGEEKNTTNKTRCKHFKPFSAYSFLKSD